MSTALKETAGVAVPPRKRKHTIKKFVFSPSTKETQTPAINPDSSRRPRLGSKNADNAFLNSYGKMDHVVEGDKSDRVCFIHNHKIVRASKVYINIYHLWQKWINRALKTVGLGGGYHTAIEIMGKEYHFGGCNQIDSGIFESRPLHQMKSCPHSNDFHMTESDWIAAEMSEHMGPMKKRQVIGLWSGSEADVDLLMRHLKEEGNWKGLNYKLLSFNCNHFVREACDILLKHSKHFHPAKGMTSTDTMVPPYLFKLANFIKSRYLRCVIGTIEEEDVDPPDEERFTFRGRPRYSIPSVTTREYHPSTQLYEPSRAFFPGDGCPSPHRRQSLPELRQLRVLALDNKPRQRHSEQRVWNGPRTSLSIMTTDPTDQTSCSIMEDASTSSAYDFKQSQSIESKRSEPSCNYRSPSRTKTVKASSSRTDQLSSHRQLHTVASSSESMMTMGSGSYEKRLDGIPPRQTQRSSTTVDDAFMRTALSHWNTQTMHSTTSCMETGDRSPVSCFIEEGMSGEDLGARFSLMRTLHKEQGF